MRACWLALLLFLSPGLATAQGAAPAGRIDIGTADWLLSLNALRAEGCGAQSRAAAGLMANEQLSQAARLLARGAELEDALKQVHYKANRSFLLALRGYQAAGGLDKVLRGNYCAHVLDPQYAQVGAFQQRDAVWLVLAAPFTPPAPEASAAIAREVLALVNTARREARVCGGRSFAATGSVRLNAALGAAAMQHARDMATKDFFDHSGSDGSTPAVRANRAGYPWREIGENIAAGQNTPAEAVAGWLKSPPHCANLMAPQHTEMGLAYAVNLDSSQGIYWVQVFAAPR